MTRVIPAKTIEHCNTCPKLNSLIYELGIGRVWCNEAGKPIPNATDGDRLRSKIEIPDWCPLEKP